MTGFAWIDALLANPVFAGVGGAAIVSGLMYQLRALPGRAYHGIKKAIVVELEIDNSQGVYDDVLELIAKLDSAKRSRRLKLVQSYDKEEDRWLWTPTIGRGLHLLRDGSKWMLVNRTIDDQSKGELRPRERLEIMLLGRGQSDIRDLVARARKRESGADTLQVYLWAGGCYQLADEKPRRPLDTVFIPPAQRARLLADLAAFMAGKSEYRRRGTPWRRGYLLEGPPGTGKSSLIFALACEFSLPLYIINLNTVNGDTGLQCAFSAVPPRGIAVIEDIDALEITHQRQPRRAAAPSAPAPAALEPAMVVTLSGLLNAIDGVAACAGAGDLVHLLEQAGLVCDWGLELEPQGSCLRNRWPIGVGDALGLTARDLGAASVFISNLPWERSWLHPLVKHLSALAPLWSLHDASWAYTRQAVPFRPLLTDIAAVGRLKWFAASRYDPPDDCAWYRFDAAKPDPNAPPRFHLPVPRGPDVAGGAAAERQMALI